jgi:hypothetical protein
MARLGERHARRDDRIPADSANAMPAAMTASRRVDMLPLESMTSPTVTGVSSLSKKAIGCGRPSSKTANASRGNPDTNPARRSPTLT